MRIAVRQRRTDRGRNRDRRGRSFSTSVFVGLIGQRNPAAEGDGIGATTSASGARSIHNRGFRHLKEVRGRRTRTVFDERAPPEPQAILSVSVLITLIYLNVPCGSKNFGAVQTIPIALGLI
jgi:hypothetical protein